MRDAQEFAFVGERVEEFPGAFVDIVEVLAFGEPVPAEVAYPGVHLRTGNRCQLLTFPSAEVELDDGWFFFDG